MKRKGSVVGIGFHLKGKQAYYGMVHERAPHGRWQVHWRAVLQHSSGLASEMERKYEYMARQGTAASCLFLPYISRGQVIPRHKPHSLELKIIGLYRNSLNRMQHSGSPYQAVPIGGQASLCVGVVNDVQVARRKKTSNCKVERQVQAAGADGAVLSTTDLNEAIALYTAVFWHSSNPWTTTQCTRCGGSIVVLYDGEGNSFVGLVKAAVDTVRKWGVGQRYLEQVVLEGATMT